MAGQSRASRAALAAALSCGVALAAWSGVAAARAELRFRAAAAASAAGDYAAARELLARGLRDDPDSARLLFHSARASRRDGDYALAAKFLPLAGRRGWPAEAVEWEATLLKAQTGEFAAHEGRLRTAAAAAPDHPDADLLREVLVPGYISRYQLAEAYTLLVEWISRRPDALRPRLWMFEVARRMLLPQEAIDSARAAAAFAPDNPDARARCGQILIENHQPAEAKLHFDWLLARRPGDAAARLGGAKCLRELGDEAGATRELTDLLAARPDRADYLAELGRVHAQAGRSAAARDCFRRALESDPSGTDLLYNYALCLEQTGQSAEAARWREAHKRAEADLLELKEVTKRFAGEPTDPALAHRAGELLMRNGHEWEAVRWFRKALQVAPDHPASREAIAAYYARVRQAARD